MYTMPYSKRDLNWKAFKLQHINLNANLDNFYTENKILK